MKSTPRPASIATARRPSSGVASEIDDGELALRPVEHRAGDDHPRAEQLPGLDVAPRREDRLEVAAHVAHARDAVGDEEAEA